MVNNPNVKNRCQKEVIASGIGKKKFLAYVEIVPESNSKRTRPSSLLQYNRVDFSRHLSLYVFAQLNSFWLECYSFVNIAGAAHSYLTGDFLNRVLCNFMY